MPGVRRKVAVIALLLAESSAFSGVNMFQSHAPSVLSSRLPALRPCQISNGAFVRVGQSKVDAPACRRSQRTCWAASSGKGFGDSSGSGAPPPPETEAQKRELENLRQLAAQAQRAPDRAETAVRGKVRTLQKEFQTKVGMRKVIADKAAELMGKAATDPRLAAAVNASATEAVLRKNPQVSQLDADLLRISKEIRNLLPPGLCALESPSKTYGYVRELNAMPAVLALQVASPALCLYLSLFLSISLSVRQAVHVAYDHASEATAHNKC